MPYWDLKHWVFPFFPAESSEQAKNALHKLAQDDYAVIYITEQSATGLENEINQYQEKRFPAIILIPGVKGSLGIGMKGIKKTVEKAVGADILFQDE